jgi:hypothetical protein
MRRAVRPRCACCARLPCPARMHFFGMGLTFVSALVFWVGGDVGVCGFGVCAGPAIGKVPRHSPQWDQCTKHLKQGPPLNVADPYPSLLLGQRRRKLSKRLSRRTRMAPLHSRRLHCSGCQYLQRSSVCSVRVQAAAYSVVPEARGKRVDTAFQWAPQSATLGLSVAG